jgi:hypothetical protein
LGIGVEFFTSACQLLFSLDETVCVLRHKFRRLGQIEASSSHNRQQTHGAYGKPRQDYPRGGEGRNHEDSQYSMDFPHSDPSSPRLMSLIVM